MRLRRLSPAAAVLKLALGLVRRFRTSLVECCAAASGGGLVVVPPQNSLVKTVVTLLLPIPALGRFSFSLSCKCPSSFAGPRRARTRCCPCAVRTHRPTVRAERPPSLAAPSPSRLSSSWSRRPRRAMAACSLRERLPPPPACPQRRPMTSHCSDHCRRMSPFPAPRPPAPSVSSLGARPPSQWPSAQTGRAETNPPNVGRGRRLANARRTQSTCSTRAR